MNYDVFISYKSQSINVVKAIDHVLKSENIRCWYAPRDLDNQSAGKDYDDKIVEAINNCSLLVVVLSNAALTSDWVKAEVSQAQKQKKLVIPYVVSELKVENGLRMRLESKHWIDAYPNPERKFSLLLRNIKIFLNNTPSEDGDIIEEKRFSVDEAEDYTVDFDYDEGVALLEAEEYNDAAFAFLASAERGNKKAKDQLCQMFYDLEGYEDKIQDELWDSIERQAKEGHCYANFLLHCKVYKDATNNLVSFEYLKKAIRSNTIGLAFLRMGIQYNWGMGVKQSHILGMHYYKKAKALDCKESYSYIGQEYRIGNDKIPRDETKALEYFAKGIELNDKRAYTQLTYFYLYDKHDQEKAIEVAKKAIKSGVKKGYTLLGDVYNGDGFEIESDNDKAIRWYKEGLKHDEKSAFGSLAILYYNQGEYDYAFDMARRGKYVNDSTSLFMLGLLYENEEKYDEAWQCYREQYDKFGIGADNLANLIMYKSYRPKDITDEAYNRLLDETEQLLEIQARNYSQSCVEALIKLYCFRIDGVPSLDYDIVKKVPKALDFIKLGAEMEIPEMMYYLGNTIFNDKNNEKINPYKGIIWLEKAAYTGYKDALISVIDIYSHGKYQDHVELVKLLEYAKSLALDGNDTVVDILLDTNRFDTIHKELDLQDVIQYCLKENLVNEKILPTILNSAELSSETLVSDYISYLTKIIEEKSVDKSYLIKVAFRLLDLTEEHGSIKIPDNTMSAITDILGEQFDADNLGVFCKLKTDKGLTVISPDYDEKEIFDHFADASMTNRKLFYARYYACPNETELSQNDDFLKRLYSEFTFDDTLLQDAEKYDNDIKEVIQAMSKFQTSYHQICSKKGIHPQEYSLPAAEDQFPYMPMHVCAKISHDTFNHFMSLHDHYQDIYEHLFPILGDDNAILDYIETLSDNDIQLFLISYVEIKIDVEILMVKYSYIVSNNKDNQKKKIAEYLNNILDTYGEKVKSKEEKYTEDNIPDFSNV